MSQTRPGVVARCALIALVVLSPDRLGAQEALPNHPSPDRWIVATDPATNLWFHSLAVLGVRGPGSLPFYSDRYARVIADAKRKRAIPPTRLDRDAMHLRAAFMADSAFEVLHFLPLYLTQLAPEALPGVLRRASTRTDDAGVAHEFVAALRAALPSNAEQAALTELAAAIDDEWRSFYAGFLAVRADTAADAVRALQARWNERFTPQLVAFLGAVGGSSGRILVSPALGTEGRIVNLGPAGIVVAVGNGVSTSIKDAPLLLAIRELCFPFIEQLTERGLTGSGLPALASEERASAAVQCGALLVDAALPEMSSDYRSLFLSARSGETPAQHRLRFDERFQVDARTMRLISGVIARVATPASGPSP
jgi:hypothetical protein